MKNVHSYMLPILARFHNRSIAIIDKLLIVITAAQIVQIFEIHLNISRMKNYRKKL